ncbi:MAG: type II toxin-antitoxin system HicB family antitoxin [Methylomonas sp.]|jgi:predicted RNase H-like HicB family nuclease
MKVYTAIIEKCRDTGLYVRFIPGFIGAHSQAESLDELNKNLREVIEMLLEDGDPILETEFVGTQNRVPDIRERRQAEPWDETAHIG